MGNEMTVSATLYTLQTRNPSCAPCTIGLYMFPPSLLTRINCPCVFYAWFAQDNFVSLWLNRQPFVGWGCISEQRKKIRLMCKIEFLCLWGDKGKCFYHIWPDHRCIILKLLLAGLISKWKENVLWLLPWQLSLEGFKTFSEQCTMKAGEVRAVFVTKYLWLLTFDSLIV